MPYFTLDCNNRETNGNSADRWRRGGGVYRPASAPNSVPDGGERGAPGIEPDAGDLESSILHRRSYPRRLPADLADLPDSQYDCEPMVFQAAAFVYTACRRRYNQPALDQDPGKRDRSR